MIDNLNVMSMAFPIIGNEFFFYGANGFVFFFNFTFEVLPTSCRWIAFGEENHCYHPNTMIFYLNHSLMVLGMKGKHYYF